MHELPVTESILEIASKHAANAGALRVTGINIVIGQLSSIVDDSIQFYWEILAKNSLCEGAVLHFERIPARLKCNQCANEFGIDGSMSPCPKCGSPFFKLISGQEFYVDSIEIEQSEEKA